MFSLCVVLAATVVAGPADYPVRLGDRDVVSIHAGVAGADAQERAARASYALALALADPECGPEGIVARRGDGGAPVRIEACGRSVIEVVPEDGAWDGRDVATTATGWHAAIRDAFAAEKEALYSGRLVRKALLGLLYPLAFVAALVVVAFLSRRARARLLLRRDGRGVRVGPLGLLETDAERVFLARIVALLRWVASAALAYAFLATMFRQFPGTRDWAAAMVRPLATIAADAAWGLVALVPRLLVVAAVLIVTRLALRAVTRLFDQVRRGEARLGPLVSPENVTPAEKTVKIFLVIAALVLAALILPGVGGQALIAALLLAGLALALGAQRGAADLIAGLVVVYGRPFRTGQRIRVGGQEGTVTRKGLLHTILAAPDGSPVLLPNRAVLSETITIVEPSTDVRGEVAIETAAGADAIADLLRAALRDAGLDAPPQAVRLAAVRDGRLVFAIDAQPTAGAAPEGTRERFLRALLARTAAAGARVGAALESKVAVP